MIGVAVTAAKELGSFECLMDPSSGLPTDKIAIEIRETDPCIRPCVEIHESSHARDLKSVCSNVHSCLKKAGKDESKKDRCLDIYEEDLYAKTVASECKAYTEEEKCMDKRQSRPECKTEKGKSHWTEHSKIMKCYKKCFCKTGRRKK